ncbi:unnamed protein product [Lampetra planeri]
MDRAAFSLLALMILLLSWTCSAETDQEALSCPEHQEGFDGSCYELVTLQRPFLTAQGWCERGGGHIAFILNDETQQFLQKHLEPDKDWWLGLAPASPNLTLDSAATEDVSYNNWVDLPDADAACGHVLRHSGFQWAATANCSQELNFICQFARCRGLQACHAPVDLSSFGEPCPVLGSYLSVEYHCKHGTRQRTAPSAAFSMANLLTSSSLSQLLRRGCNNLTLAASNMVTARTVSAELQLCLLEPVDGLQASVAADDRECPDSHELVIGVSLERGAPAQLLFSLTGANDTLSDTREIVNGSQQLFTFSSPIEGSHLRCSNADVVKSVFLPLGDKNNDFRLSIVVTVKNRFQETSTTVHAQVRQSSSDASVEDLQSAMDESVTQLEQDGQLSTEALGQIFTSVSEVLNAETDEGQKDARSKLREQMLTRMNTFLLDSPTNTSQDVQTTARAVAVLTQRSDELSPTAQEEASALLLDLSSSLNTITVQDAEDDVEVVFVATPIIEAASNILTVSSNEKVSDSLLSGMNNIQSALLHQKKVNEGPIIIGSEQISVYVNRPDVEQENSTIVDLANFSTIIINVPSPDVTLVIKLEPSEDISLRLLLGYKEYPSDENYLANTQIPHADSKEEEQYTWVLGPNDREGTTGVHFLVMKPVVEPGVKSINATVNVVTIAAQCKYWNEHDSSWSENGCRVTVTLLGTEGESEPHHLTDPEKNVFERGEEDMFLLTTHFSLGELQSIRLWHDNSGAHPAW